MNYVIKDREPADALRFFEDVSAIPRASGNEKGIADFMMKFALDRGLEAYKDEWNNVIIKKPGSKGCEHLPAVMLQGHLDIVPEKNQDTVHDWEHDGLKLRVEGDILKATGTTLGCDDGYALAYMMAVLDRNNLVHPPLECVMTSMEEIGLIGAMKMSGEHLTARTMIGMDGGSEGKFLVSSAGGCYTFVTVPFETKQAEGKALGIHIRGLLGGHSGALIHTEKGNSNKIMGRILFELKKAISFDIAKISGGFKGNAIPREADCVIVMAENDIAKAIEIIKTVEAKVKNELQFSDKGFHVVIEENAKAETVIDKDAAAKVIRLSHVLPNGMMMKHMEIEGLTNASLNVGVVTQHENEIVYEVTVRSAEDSLVDYISETVADIADVVGANCEIKGKYPAFAYNPESRIRKIAMEQYKKMTGLDGKINAVHGGTEAGVLSALLPGLDIVGIGPNAGGAHTPDEYVELPSFKNAFDLLLNILEELPK
ncbi:MAG: beta-Ala-His dipeptidase [Clostridia bacterium]|nr:beta-Ala-His dipeptidase [Clostridia bacterium]